MGSLKENIKGIEWAKFIAIVEIVRGDLSIFSIFTVPLGGFGNKYRKLP